MDKVSQADAIWQAATCHFARRQHFTRQGINNWLDKVQTVYNCVLVLFIAQLTAKVMSERNADHKFTSKVWFAGPVHVTLWWRGLRKNEVEWTKTHNQALPIAWGCQRAMKAVWNQLQAGRGTIEGCGSQHSGTFISAIRHWGGGVWLERCVRTPFYG